MKIQHLNAGLNPRFKCAVLRLNRGFNPRFWKAGLEGLGSPMLATGVGTLLPRQAGQHGKRPSMPSPRSSSPTTPTSTRRLALFGALTGCMSHHRLGSCFSFVYELGCLETLPCATSSTSATMPLLPSSSPLGVNFLLNSDPSKVRREPPSLLRDPRLPRLCLRPRGDVCPRQTLQVQVPHAICCSPLSLATVLALDPRFLQARATTCVAIALAVWHCDAKLARVLLKRSATARRHMRCSGGVVTLVHFRLHPGL